MGKERIKAKVRTCNCTDFVLGEGIVRSLLEETDSKWKRVNKEPCNHWETISAQIYQRGKV